MNISIRRTMASVLMATCMLAAMAVPAKPGLLEMKQPDGTTIKVKLYGDEFHHFYVSEDGYYLVNEGDTFYYANVDASGATVNSGIVATPPAARSAAARSFLATVDMNRVRSTMTTAAQARLSNMAQTAHIATPAFAQTDANTPRKGPGLFPGTHFPASGTQKGLVILVEYTDVKMNLSNPHDYFSRMLNEEGFNTSGGTGSAKDFFLEVSSGKFDPDFDVYGPVTLPHNMAYYGGNDYSGNDQRPAHMVKDACDLLDSEIDFSQYDRDGDGEVDNVFVFYAGRGEASGGSSSTVWPHAWNVEYGVGSKPRYDGVYVSRYACSNEWEGSGPDGVGTFIHEFSHVMGLPDLYATSYTSSFTPGSWSCMDYGPYNNNGRTPPLYGAFERYALGWLEPVVLNGPADVTLPAIGQNVAAIIKTASANEFFLFENRQKESWDKYIPGHGMLAWHIDYNSSVWNNNVVNNTPSHQYVDIEEADGTQSESSRAGDAFPGTAKKSSFTDSGTPNMKTWSGQNLNMPLTEITETDGVITFQVCGGEAVELVLPEEVSTVAYDEESFTASWRGSQGHTYLISVFTRPDKTVTGEEGRVYVDGYKSRNVGSVTTYRVTGLVAGTTYYYTVASALGSKTSEESPEIAVTTGHMPIGKLTVNALEPFEITDNSFMASWEKLPQATDYILNVFIKVPKGSLTQVCDFANGVDNLPEGWESNSRSSYAMEPYAGKAIPSLRLTQSLDYIATPAYEADVLDISFWHRGSNTSASDQLVVYAAVNNNWQVVKRIPVVAEVGGSVSSLSINVPGANRLRIEAQLTDTRSSIAIDDIAVSYGIQPERRPVAGYQNLHTGNVESYLVKDLNPSTLYHYTIQATDGTNSSVTSNEIAVETAANSAILGIEASDAYAPVEYYNLQGIRIDRPTHGIYIRRQGNTTTKVVM
ncbi:MAG: M6 family metalloprotease domain-containing protein [Muribaculaceae bacterium]|nr:M6 family metalloprotease domain-containing protein [Muribaculaceae bacterium]